MKLFWSSILPGGMLTLCARIVAFKCMDTIQGRCTEPGYRWNFQFHLVLLINTIPLLARAGRQPADVDNCRYHLGILSPILLNVKKILEKPDINDRALVTRVFQKKDYIDNMLDGYRSK